ncbi:ECF transporter S component [[Acholeplasma] multilocale]|uniref:ECF transporter S component n=1 Tax=[Acholeplasma] multilocale TaxID=264638 RepID=UPI00047BB82C|nr:ECF transporter S component [[Acholeplasma] multilocale]
MGKNKNPKDLLNDLKRDLAIDPLEEKDIEAVEHRVEDHYHGKHHFDKFGNHDDIDENEFKPSHYFKMTKKNLTFKIALTAVMLALAIAVSALDMLLESFAIPVGDQVFIQTRFLDIAVILSSIAVLGPLFSAIVGGIVPIIHNLMHGMVHGWVQPITDIFQNIAIVFIVWFIFYILFKNSPIHRDDNKKVYNFKRWTPSVIIVPIVAILATAMFVLALYIQQQLAPGHDDDLIRSAIQMRHEGHDHEGEISFGNINTSVVFAIFGWNVLRYAAAYVLFALIEGRMRPINHRYK